MHQRFRVSHVGSILKCFFLFNTGEWEHWNNRVEEYIYPKDHNPDFLSILVPNVDNVRTDYLIQVVSSQGKVREYFKSVSQRVFVQISLPYYRYP